MNLYDETQMVLNQYGLKAKKSYGQNFLINEDVIRQIVDKAQISSDDVVLEIGPGIGTLTKELLKFAKKVIAVEIDDDMINVLNGRFNNDNLEIINKDILKLNIDEITRENGPIKVVANLPYYITTPIIMKLLENRYDISEIVCMVQKEVGERICATSMDKENSSITIAVRYYANPEIILYVPKEDFYPIPEVDSCVLKLEVLKKSRFKLKDESKFFALVKAAFSQRRKTILNSLASIEYTKDEIGSVLEKLQISPKLRAENLSIEDFANISNELCSNEN